MSFPPPYNRRRGELNAGATLTETDVLAIRHTAAAGEKQRDIATRYGITPTAVSKIVRGAAWTHVGGPRKRTTVAFETTP